MVIIKERSSSNLTKIASVEQEPRIGITKFFLGFLRIFLQHPNIIKTKYVPSYFFKRFGKKTEALLVLSLQYFCFKQEHRSLNEF